MCHQNRRTAYVLLGIVTLAPALASLLDFSVAYVLVVTLCPLLMFLMMWPMGEMSGDQAHTGHGCEHDRTCRVHLAEPHS